MKADAGREPGRQLAVHRTASGQDFEQSGCAGFSLEQQGMLSDIDAISDVVAIWAAPIVLADDRPTVGAIKRLKDRKHREQAGDKRPRLHRVTLT
ncbi:hypothetical protein [Bradyrhizobium sp. WSM1253]|uniref:hypothetical protein n=1 Tax=Bradyrhizobium sp. WSM1253 TaxID=319003 RepID=UPI0012F4C0BD|nr:hypothetical protein [Bradyrhizobium sp. WSM1253]